MLKQQAGITQLRSKLRKLPERNRGRIFRVGWNRVALQRREIGRVGTTPGREVCYLAELLKERKDTNSPGTNMSTACQQMSGKPSMRVFPHLFHTGEKVSTELHQNGEYAHGDRSHVKNQRLLNGYTLVP